MLHTMKKTMKKTYTKDWFSNNAEAWSALFAAHSLPKNACGLEIGSFEGRSACWLMDNVLKHPDARLHCVDRWPNRIIHDRFARNTAEYEERVVTHKGHAASILRAMPPTPTFDFAYLDADKHSESVLECLVLVLPLVKPGGLIIIDDYTHNEEHDMRCPRPGVDAFMNVFARHFRVLSARWQVVLEKRKRKAAFPSGPDKQACVSEYYARKK